MIARLLKTQLLILLAFVVTITVASAQNRSLLVDDFPERYTVVEGDTLWDISSRFLRDPWRWPEVWQGNPQVENPDLIYPGDVLVMTVVDGTPVLRSLRRETVKLSPQARITRYDAIPLIDPASIQAYINSPLVTDEAELENSPYVVDGFDNRLLMGQYDKFYARGVTENADKYRVFRPGRKFVDPISGEVLGMEALHVGDANLMRAGDPAKLVLTTGYEEITARDRMRPVYEDEVVPFIAPQAPANENINGVILNTLNKSAELGALSVIAINLGEREGIRVGDVFRIRSQKYAKRDPMTGEQYFIPHENIGLALTFRTFEKVSYALITDTNQQVRPGDILVSPNAELGSLDEE